jgi:chaperonin cofactor prefoldin
MGIRWGKACIELPQEKVDKLTAEIHRVTRKEVIPRKQFEQLRGKLRHACIGIPAGKGLMGPIDAEL